MVAGFVLEKDFNGVERKILSEILDTDKHAMAGVVYANGFLVDTAHPFPVGGTVLTATEADLAAILTLLTAVKSGSSLNAAITSGTATITGAVSMGIPAGATKKQKQLRLTASTGSVDLWTPASGKRIAVKSLLVTWQGANACRLTIWQGTNADTTYSGGASDNVENVLFDQDIDADANGGAHIVFPDGYPWETDTADHELHVTLSANKVVFIQAVGDERT